jgi:hypothetical protein
MNGGRLPFRGRAGNGWQFASIESIRVDDAGIQCREILLGTVGLEFIWIVASKDLINFTALND